ncbi:hypothetical protein QQP08_002604 [Theobroma cacao]|nr:hypothetical protein QQP08_002604 [Theobroma cacao]
MPDVASTNPNSQVNGSPCYTPSLSIHHTNSPTSISLNYLPYPLSLSPFSPQWQLFIPWRLPLLSLTPCSTNRVLFQEYHLGLFTGVRIRSSMGNLYNWPIHSCLQQDGTLRNVDQ